jgi:hypothetical protein
MDVICLVMMKLSRWTSPDKWARFVMSRWSCLSGSAKTKTTERWLVAYWLCLGCRNSQGAKKVDKWVKIFSHRLSNALRICLATEGNKLYRLCWLQLFLSGSEAVMFYEYKVCRSVGVCLTIKPSSRQNLSQKRILLWCTWVSRQTG